MITCFVKTFRHKIKKWGCRNDVVIKVDSDIIYCGTSTLFSKTLNNHIGGDFIIIQCANYISDVKIF